MGRLLSCHKFWLNWVCAFGTSSLIQQEASFNYSLLFHAHRKHSKGRESLKWGLWVLSHWIWWGKGRKEYLFFRHSSCLLLNCLQNIMETLSYFTLKANGAAISRSTGEWKVEEHCWIYGLHSSKIPQVLPVILEASNLWHQNLLRKHCKMQLQWAWTWVSLPLTFEWKPKSDPSLSWIKFQISLF